MSWEQLMVITVVLEGTLLEHIPFVKKRQGRSARYSIQRFVDTKILDRQSILSEMKVQNVKISKLHSII